MEEIREKVEDCILEIDKFIFSETANVLSILEDNGFILERLMKDFINDKLEICYEIERDWKIIEKK